MIKGGAINGFFLKEEVGYTERYTNDEIMRKWDDGAIGKVMGMTFIICGRL